LFSTEEELLSVIVFVTGFVDNKLEAFVFFSDEKKEI
jgi:hypothetical protein